MLPDQAHHRAGVELGSRTEYDAEYHLGTPRPFGCANMCAAIRWLSWHKASLRNLGPLAVYQHFHRTVLDPSACRPAILTIAAIVSRTGMLESAIPLMELVMPDAMVAISHLSGYRRRHDLHCKSHK